MILEQDDLESLMERIARDTIYLGRIASLEEQLEAIEHVTVKDIQEVMREAWGQASQCVTG